MLFSLAIVALGISVMASPASESNMGAHTRRLFEHRDMPSESGAPCTTTCNTDAYNGSFEQIVPDCHNILDLQQFIDGGACQTLTYISKFAQFKQKIYPRYIAFGRY